MSGLVKAKKYDWKDSNMALFGSDTEKKVKKESAQTEPAWKGAGEKVGMQIWRIVKFKVTHWPKDEYGKFYNGDSYIILNTYKDEDSDALLYDVHFWIGQYSTQDEYGTAAYKTVELDTLLDDKPVQHREVMNHESELFRGYFPEIQLLQGGAETGFNHVVTNKLDYKPRLLHFDGDTRDAKTKKRKVTVRERPMCKKSLDSDDVFILDKGEDLYLWLGKTANKDEKFAAVQYMQKLKEERRGRVKTENIDERDDDANRKFRAMLPDETDEEGINDEEEESDDQFEPSLFRLSDAGGQMEFSCVSQGSIPRSMLDSSDVFIADTGKAVFVWVGKGASEGERKNGMTYAHNYLMKTKHPLVPVTQVAEGKENKEFLAIVS